MRYTLRQLEVFLAVARSQSVSRAAEELAMSQSAVSSALADLEGQFDIQLFDRIGKRLQLSGLGRVLRPRAEALQAQASGFEQALANHSDLGLLRVGATLTIGNYVTVPLMAKFMQEQPGARISLEVANTAQIAHKLANFEIDVGLVEGQVHDADLEASRWCEDELVVFCAPNHPFAKRRSLRDDDLREAQWIVRERGSGTRQAFDQAMRDLLPELSIALELQHTEAIKSAAVAGLGVGCVSRICVADEFKHGTLHACRVPERDFRRHFYFVLHRHKYRTPGVQRWLELCRREFRP
ncbi:MAG TPA: LysR family transcriptional regulator [Polyangiales bacterium]|nr:LysR family transcriptional regulator [Polyangiales bacterium]